MIPVSVQPVAKAVVPFVLTAVAVLGHWAGTGDFDRVELVAAVTGAVAAVITYAVPNRAA